MNAKATDAKPPEPPDHWSVIEKVAWRSGWGDALDHLRELAADGPVVITGDSPLDDPPETP